LSPLAAVSRDRVLVVDDDPGMRYAATRVLAPLYEVEEAATVGEALARVGARGAAPFQVALVDLQLPDGDGYALCQALRRAAPGTDVILMTGSVSHPDEKLFRALEGDAFYFLFKPFDRRVLLALVERCVRLQRERRAKERYADELARDLERARRFQRSLMPAGAVAVDGWRAEGRFLPCDALGGDFYLALPDHQGGLVVALADVVGHGVAAAMYAGMLRSVLDAARRRDPDPRRVLPELLAGVDFFTANRFATLAYARLGGDGRVSWFNAGHPPPLLADPDGGLTPLAPTGTVLAASLAGLPREVRTAAMPPGSRLLLYSDGIVEARDPAGREWGEERLRDLFAATRHHPAGEALDRLLAGVHAHGAGRPAVDDATLLLVERTG
jgi:sigma-B regulation protein RsbU (phosphoserine phosphatase)